jgi:hypothetical protein
LEDEMEIRTAGCKLVLLVKMVGGLLNFLYTNTMGETGRLPLFFTAVKDEDPFTEIFFVPYKGQCIFVFM